MAADPSCLRFSPGRAQDGRNRLVPDQERLSFHPDVSELMVSCITDVLPPDSERKLEIAQGIINAAFRQKAAEMGGELQRLRMLDADKDSQIRSLEGRFSECQDSLRDIRAQLQTSLEQNDALQSERVSLINSLRKLEAFKRNLLHTLQASDVVGMDGAGAPSSTHHDNDRGDRWARHGSAGDHLRANGSKSLDSTAQTPLQEPDSYQDYIPSAGHTEAPARHRADNSQAFLLNGNGSLHSQADEAAGPARAPNGSHISPDRHSERQEHTLAQQCLQTHAARRASHDGTYQAGDMTGLSLGDTAFNRSAHDPLGRSHLDLGPRATNGGNSSLLHIPLDLQTGSAAEGLPGRSKHEAPLPNGRGHAGPHHHAPTYSPRNTQDVSYQAPGSYSARPEHPVYNGAFDDRPLPREGYNSSASGPPSQAVPQAKDRSEGREFFRRARARLSNDAFRAFLQAIKDMNAGITGRSETLRTAGDIFAGPDADLYHDFRALLDSHLPSK